MVALLVLAMAQAADSPNAVAAPVSLDRLADVFDQICVAPNGNTAAMKAAADAYRAKYPGTGQPSYGAMQGKTGMSCFVFAAVAADTDMDQLRGIATARFHADFNAGKPGRNPRSLTWKSDQREYQAELSDQKGRRVGLLSISFLKGNR
jgi:hypothetical protein